MSFMPMSDPRKQPSSMKAPPFFFFDPLFLKSGFRLDDAALLCGLALTRAEGGPGAGHDVGGTVIGVAVFASAIFGFADAIVKAGLLDVDREHFLGGGLHLT